MIVPLRAYVVGTYVLYSAGIGTAVTGLVISEWRLWCVGALVVWAGMWSDRRRSDREILARYIRVVAYWKADIEASRTGQVRPDPELLTVPPDEPLHDEPTVPAARKVE